MNKDALKSAEEGSAVFVMCLYVFGVSLIAMGAIWLIFEKLKVEQLLDRIHLEEGALFGAKELPFGDDAVNVATDYAETFGLTGRESLTVKFSDDRSEIKLVSSRKIPIPFLGLFSSDPEVSTGGYLLSRVEARAHVIPRDLVLFLDTSKYLGPSVDGDTFYSELRLNGAYSRWRQTNETAHDELWHPSPYLASIANQICSGSACSQSRNKEYIATQQCFNPVFTSLKEGMYYMYDYLVSMGKNRVGVLAGPTVDNGIGIVREFGSMTPLTVAREASTDPRSHSGHHLSDNDCLYAAEEAHFGHDKQSDGLLAWMQGRWAEPRDKSWKDEPNPNDFLAGPGWRQYGYPSLAWNQQGKPQLGVQSRVNETAEDHREKDFRGPTPGTLNPDLMAKSLTARQAIWSKVLNPTNVVSFPKILKSVQTMLFKSPPASGRPYPDANVLAQAFLLLGEYPHGRSGKMLFLDNEVTTLDAEVRDQIKASLHELDRSTNGRTVWVFLVMMRHDGMKQNCATTAEVGPQLDCVPYFQRFEAFEEFIARQNEQLSHTKLYVIRMPDPDTVFNEGAGLLPLMGKKVKLF